MESVRCPLCRSDDSRVIAEIADYTEPFRNVICERCAFVYANPRPDATELAAYYERQFIQGRHQIQSVEEARERAKRKGSQAKYSTEGLRDGLSPSSSVLEIGCSYGFLLNAVKRDTGSRVFGVEPSDVSGKFATEEFGIPVFHGTVERYLETPVTETFDLIIMYHVLEHVADPVRVLSALRERLASNGRLYVCVPDVTHLQEPPETFFQVPHVTSFSPWTLSLALWRAGFKPISIVRKLRAPKNGMEMTAARVDDPRSALPVARTLPGHDPRAVESSVARAGRQYAALRGVKRLLGVVLPKSSLERAALPIRTFVRHLRDLVG